MTLMNHVNPKITSIPRQDSLFFPCIQYILKLTIKNLIEARFTDNLTNLYVKKVYKDDFLKMDLQVVWALL